MTIPSDLTPPAGVQARSDLRRRAGLRFIGVTICLDVVSHTIVFPVLPKLVEELLGGDVQGAARWIGVLIAIWSVAQFVAAPVIGMLSDRFGRRPVILISVFGLAVELVIMALAPTLAWLLIGRALCGLTAGAQAAAMAYVADITPQEERAKSYGWINAAAWTGVILGPAWVGCWDRSTRGRRSGPRRRFRCSTGSMACLSWPSRSRRRSEPRCRGARPIRSAR